MSENAPPHGSKAPQTAAQVREARLKAALKANMGRRKQQARARTTPADAGNKQNKGQ